MTTTAAQVAEAIAVGELARHKRASGGGGSQAIFEIHLSQRLSVQSDDAISQWTHGARAAPKELAGNCELQAHATALLGRRRRQMQSWTS